MCNHAYVTSYLSCRWCRVCCLQTTLTVLENDSGLQDQYDHRVSGAVTNVPRRTQEQNWLSTEEGRRVGAPYIVSSLTPSDFSSRSALSLRLRQFEHHFQRLARPLQGRSER